MNNPKHEFKKNLGQNFLRDKRWAEKIISYLEIIPGDNIIEIGPGQGYLTSHLLEAGANVFAVELDHELVPFLLGRFGNHPNFHLVESDILEVDLEADGSKRYKVAGSLPYNISKKIIDKFFSTENTPELMTYIIQKEVAQDYTAKGPKFSFLSIYAQMYAEVEYKNTISSNEFFPRPKVDGAIVTFSNIKARRQDVKEFARFVKVGYSQPRKKLSSNLTTLGIDKSVLEAKFITLSLPIGVRAEELGYNHWLELFKTFKAKPDAN